MKLRLRANTIRLRLLKGEVDHLAQGHTIVETLPTPRPFHFAVHPSHVEDLTATFNEDTLTIEVPRDWAANWASNDEEVGRSAKTSNLDILIEKDWSCTTVRDSAEDRDTYPNPTALR